MNKISALLFLLLSFNHSFAQKSKSIARPKLVVGIVIDQMRWDYLYRYYDRYSDAGFKRLMNEGFNCQQAFIDYLPTFTAPGHTCVYTGSVPSIHGIAANDWIDNATGKHWYCTEDRTVLPVGGSYAAGSMSPRNMLTTTMTDELRLATNFRSKVYGVSLKDRGSILPAGHLANAAYWYDDSTGNFITSTFYQNTLPEWLTSFNSKRYADTFLLHNWELLYPAETYTNSLPDNNTYEGKNKGEAEPVFPHITASYAGKDYGVLRKIPGGNTMTLKMAKACINYSKLGQGPDCDFLAISLSTPDYAGHQYTPNALEMEDMYLRLDRDLASFLKYLDGKIGEGNYTIFLTADHGAAHNAEYLKDLKVPTGNANQRASEKGLRNYLKKEFKTDTFLRAIDNYQVCFNEALIAGLTIDRSALRAGICKWLEQQDGIAYAIDMENFANKPLPKRVLEMAINGYNLKRSGSIEIIMEPGWYSGYGPTGTTHGTWSPFDTHIPLLLYGWGIKPGEHNSVVNMTDIAATISTLLHIQVPNGCIGKPITQAIR